MVDQVYVDELVDMLRGGDQAAAVQLVSVVAPQLLGYGRAVAPDISDTDLELVSERAVEKALAKIDGFDRRRSSFPSWLRGFVRFEILNLRRTKPITTELQEEFLVADRPPMADNNPSPEVETLRAELTRLSETDQLIIRLRDIEGLTYKFIAQKLDVNEEACRQRHIRALARLRVKLTKTPQDPGGGER